MNFTKQLLSPVISAKLRASYKEERDLRARILGFMTKSSRLKYLLLWMWGQSGCKLILITSPGEASQPVTQCSTPPVSKSPTYCPMADSKDDVFYKKGTTFPTNNLVILFPLQTLPHNCDEEFEEEEVCSLWKSSYFILTKEVLGQQYTYNSTPTPTPPPTHPKMPKHHDAYGTIPSLRHEEVKKTRPKAIFLLGNTPMGGWLGKHIRSWFESDTF